MLETAATEAAKQSGTMSLLTGGYLLMAMGSLLALLKDIPKILYGHLVRQCTASVKITDEAHEAFTAMSGWIRQQHFFNRVRHIDARRYRTEDRQDDVTFIPAPGRHYFLRGSRPMWFQFERTESKAGWESKYIESFTLGMLGRNKSLLKTAVKEALEQQRTTCSTSCLYAFTGEYWRRVGGYEPRTLESVILPAKEKQGLVRDVENFLNSEGIYTTSGTPYRRGYLLYGLPGTGKTSVIAGLSRHFKKNVYLVQPQHMKDETLAMAVSNIPAHSVVVIEDVDCVTSAHARQVDEETTKPKDKEKSLGGVTLSGLLNCLDGLRVPHGLLFFLTTNHMEKLDEALIRPGRVDFRMPFGHATREQKEEYFRRFLRLPAPVSVMNKNMSMAEVQQEALNLRNQDSLLSSVPMRTNGAANGCCVAPGQYQILSYPAY